MHGLDVAQGRQIFYIQNLHRQYRGVVRIAPNKVAVADLAGMYQIHQVGSDLFKPAFYTVLIANINLNVFALRDPHDQATRRRLFARAFSPTMMVMATDVIAHLDFGDSFDMLEAGKRIESRFSGVICVEVSLMRALLRLLPFKFSEELVEAKQFVCECGARAIPDMHDRDGSVMNLFGQMLASCDSEEKASVSDDDIRREAGRSDPMLTYLFSDEMNCAELEAATLLNSELNETLRLYGAAPGALPHIVRSLTVGEYYIPAGSEVRTQTYTNHRDHAVFPDPLRFGAFRFVDETSWYVKKRAAYMSSGGLDESLATELSFRNCWGTRLREMEKRFLIAPKEYF
ncbi:cytochrome P450 [Ampelomyces quisqualis]|uniref:Cytochrome P450 n=1 Tax=Ampelomyces quisqualis TaxID=50730 RepID=A0A6A5QR12_AMPQU|nr:cytochrome P450 [Ampelomyces quisqualis]